jgi:hypothetical protein
MDDVNAPRVSRYRYTPAQWDMICGAVGSLLLSIQANRSLGLYRRPEEAQWANQQITELDTVMQLLKQECQ